MFVVCLFAIGGALVIAAIGGLFASAVFREPLDGMLGSLATDIIVWTCAYALLAALACFAVAAAVLRRSTRCLMLLQLLGIALIVFAAVLLVLLNITLMEQGANVIGRSILSLAGEIAALLLTTLFFCKSTRMGAWMGTKAYLDHALFRIGIR